MGMAELLTILGARRHKSFRFDGEDEQLVMGLYSILIISVISLETVSKYLDCQDNGRYGDRLTCTSID